MWRLKAFIRTQESDPERPAATLESAELHLTPRPASFQKF